ncbi:MAG TPA: transglycosylase domain-containing protein, partial [Acidimicrobiales bacterium]|nr:transglycosylase domain-containing protein [Acidimicrobiales bacterium]
MRRALRRLGQFARVIVIIVISAVTVPVVAVSTIVSALIFLPLPATLPTPKLTLASRPSIVFDANGNEIATFSEFEQQIPVNQADIPTVLKQALVASEDRNFYHHGGVDPRGSLRALIRDLQGKPLQGGSTIAQQYVKTVYTGGKRTLTRKLKEAVLASQLARQVPKDEILFKYLNAVYFGDGAYGVGAAAETYFNINVRDLDASQAAMLIGLLPAPSAFEPRGNQAVAEERRQLVLKEMLQQRYLTQKQYDDAFAEHLATPSKPPPAGTPLTLVYPPVQQKVAFPYFVDYVRRYLELDPRIGPSLLYRGGLQIQTTIDPAIEKAAETSVSNTLNGTKEPTEMSLVSVDPRNGFVKAMV